MAGRRFLIVFFLTSNFFLSEYRSFHRNTQANSFEITLYTNASLHHNCSDLADMYVYLMISKEFLFYLTTSISALCLMIPLILHHRIVDPFEITLTACAEEWQRNMNARLIYDFILLALLFILPLTLMTYCYIRIGFSLWFIDSNVQKTLSNSILNAARFSNISEDFPNDLRKSSRPLTIQYLKTTDKQFENYRSLLVLNRQRRNTSFTDSRQQQNPSSTVTSRRFSENDYSHAQINLRAHPRPIIRQRHSISQYTSGLQRTSLSSIPSQHRIRRSMRTDFEHANRFLQSRRRVVKLLITLGKNKTEKRVNIKNIIFIFSHRVFSYTIAVKYSLDLY